jgi:LDH2 family malate/lactate/ureidoglycolate dehydrogenase
VLQVTADQLRTVSRAILSAVGAPSDIAEHMANSLVQSNLMGHDSHGVIRIPAYVDMVEQGRYKPAARPEIMRETPTTAVIRGNWAFGQVAAKFAAEVVIAKAREMNVAAVGLTECNHVGRLGEYAEMIAREGMIAQVITGGFSTPWNGVAPFGGAGRALGTNPYSFGVPAEKHAPLIADFATSVIAEGKLQVARAKGIKIAEGVVLDAQGNSSTDPNDFYNGGVMLPFGGHKGYSLSLMADIFGSLLSGAETMGESPNTVGTFMLAVNIAAFRPFADFTKAVDHRFDEIKAVPPAPGFKEVLIPGEPEARSRAQRVEEGVPLPEDTWHRLVETGKKYNVDVEKLAAVK